MPRVVFGQGGDNPTPRAAAASVKLEKLEAAYGPAAPVTEEQVAAKATEVAGRATEELAARQDQQLAALRNELTREIEFERAARLDWQGRAHAADVEIAKQLERTTVGTPRTGLSLTGFVQADGAIRQSSQDQLNPSTGIPLNQDRISIRRARLRAELDRTFVAGALEFDGNTVKGATARLLGAEASLRWPAPTPDQPSVIVMTIGLFKIPFGFEVLQSDRDRQFLERSTAERGLFPGEYDAGIRLQGGWRFLRYAIAAMNGEPIGETSFPGLDPNQHKDVVGRLGVDTKVAGPVSVSAGISGLAGQGLHPGTPATKPSLIWQDRNEDGQFQSNEIQLAPGVAATSSQSFARHGLGADVRVLVTTSRLGQTVGYAEVVVAKNLDRGILPADPKALVGTSYGSVSRDMREIGWYAAATQDVGPHATVGVRYDYYNPDRDSADRTLGAQVPTSFSYSTWAIAAALRTPSARLIAQFDINRNHLGRDTSGAPANLRDNAFTVRGEVKF
jgi:hypothetical protein